MMLTSRAIKNFAPTSSVDSQDDEIIYLMGDSPWSDQFCANPYPDNVQNQQYLHSEDYCSLKQSVVTESLGEGDSEYKVHSRYFSDNVNNGPVSYRQEDIVHRYCRNEDITDDQENIEQPVASMYFQSKLTVLCVFCVVADVFQLFSIVSSYGGL